MLWDCSCAGFQKCLHGGALEQFSLHELEKLVTGCRRWIGRPESPTGAEWLHICDTSLEGQCTDSCEYEDRPDEDGYQY